MKLLVATNKKKYKYDYCYAKEGEIIKFCSSNPSCMVGVETGMATTTFKVTNVKITEKKLGSILKKINNKNEFKTPEAMSKELDNLERTFLMEAALNFKLGVVYSLSGNRF